MCCFGIRIFCLIFCTITSFILHRFYPTIPVVVYYLILINIFSFIVFSLFVRSLLPSFVKNGAVYYFAVIGGFLGAILALIIAKRLKIDKFSMALYMITLIWACIIFIVLINFDNVKNFFGIFLQ